MTVGENVALPLREHTTLEDSTIEIILRLKLQQVRARRFEYYTPAQLSGGMKKRAAVAARWRWTRDPVFRRALGWTGSSSRQAIDECDFGTQACIHMTIIVVRTSVALLIADRMLLIGKGNIVALGTTEEMRSSNHNQS